jgi:RHS repeat-associated protein
MDDLPAAVVAGVNTSTPTIYYVHTDHLGRPARMTAQNWAWVWDVIYSPFGATSYIWTNPATIDLRFPGQWFQLENGLAYNWHRHYDATLGRYIEPDPFGLKALLSDGPSVYNYVGGNPLAQVDPKPVGDDGPALPRPMVPTRKWPRLQLASPLRSDDRKIYPTRSAGPKGAAQRWAECV